MRPRGARSVIAAALLLAGCGRDSDELLVPRCAAPEIVAHEVHPLAGNVLGAVARVQTTDADSVGVRYGSSAGSLDSAAPTVPVTGDSAVVPVLGLLPETDYLIQPVAYGRCGRAAGAELRLTTGPLPVDLPRYVTGGSDPSPGYVAFGATPYGLVIDNTGRVVWYHRFPEGSGLNFQAQPNGHYVARPPAAPGEVGRWVEIDPLGAVVRTLGCARGLQPRFHDLILERDGSWWTMCDERRTMDLSLVGGLPAARVLGTVIQHVSPEGALLFEWNPFDHFAITDLPASEREGLDVNWTHGNSLDLDQDGNLLASFRNLNEITKIDTRTGAVLWRMGGRANQFTWLDTPTPAFAAQHGLRTIGTSNLLLLDNLGSQRGSRAEWYEYDEVQRTARVRRSFETDSGVVAQLGGSTQSLRDGRVLIAFGNGGRLAEYDAAGNVVWRIEGDAGYIFRAQRVGSLYHPGAGDPR